MASQNGDVKVVRGLGPCFIVDGFAYPRPECRSYFLTHYHSDHTVGLTAGFGGGTTGRGHSGGGGVCAGALIYCSPVTARLLVHDMGVRPESVVALPIGVATMVEGVAVTPLDANHCPGAVMFHFLSQPSSPSSLSARPAGGGDSVGRNSGSGISDVGRCGGGGGLGGCGDFGSKSLSVLHTGDFRAEKHLRDSRLLARLLSGGAGGLDVLYLDTTYCRPKFDFPPQKACLAAVRDAVKRELAREPRTLVAVAAYSLGKERAIEAAVRAAGGLCLVSDQRARMLRLCGWWRGAPPEDDRGDEGSTGSGGRVGGEGGEDGAPLFTTDPHDPLVVALVLGSGGGSHACLALAHASLPPSQRARFSCVVGFQATGWTYTRSMGQRGIAAPPSSSAGVDFNDVDDDDVSEAVPGDDGSLDVSSPISCISSSGGPQGGGPHGGSATSPAAAVSSDLASCLRVWVETAEEKRAVAQALQGAAGSNSAGYDDQEGKRSAGSDSTSASCLPVVGSFVETRVYTVPYSEHSSYGELQDFVKHTRPKAIVPTVVPGPGPGARGGNGGKGGKGGSAFPKPASEQRRALVDAHFAAFMDLRQDRSRIVSYFQAPVGGAGSVAAQSSLSRSSSLSSSTSKVVKLPSAFFSPRRGTGREPTLNAAASYLSPPASAVASSSCKRDLHHPAASVESLSGIIFGAVCFVDDEAPELKYLRQLLHDARGSIEVAVAIHFGSNGGCMPQSFRDLGTCDETPAAVVASAERASGRLFPGDDRLVINSDIPLIGSHFVVFGADNLWTRFGSRARAEARLKELGAAVTPRRTLKTTHVLLASGADRAEVPHRLLPPPSSSGSSTHPSPPLGSSDHESNASGGGATASQSSNAAAHDPSATVWIPVDNASVSRGSNGSPMVVDESWLFRTLRRVAAWKDSRSGEYVERPEEELQEAAATSVGGPMSSRAAVEPKVATVEVVETKKVAPKRKPSAAKAPKSETAKAGDSSHKPAKAASSVNRADGNINKRRKLLKATPARMTRVVRCLESSDPSGALALAGPRFVCSEVHHRFRVAEDPTGGPQSCAPPSVNRQEGGGVDCSASEGAVPTRRPVFQCDIQDTPCCDCAEFMAQNSEFPCRHLAFIFVKVLGVDFRAKHSLVYQRRLLESELLEILGGAAATALGCRTEPSN